MTLLAPLSAILVTAVAGGLGAVARLLLTDSIEAGRRAVSARNGRRLCASPTRPESPSRPRHPFPWGTFIINVTGSFALGFLVGAAAARVVPDDLTTIVGVGFLGGYTTFSTASVDTVAMLHRRQLGAAVLNVGGMLLAGSVAAIAGFALGSTFAQAL